jgi:hypothetical protein
LGCLGGLIGLSINASFPFVFSDFGYLEPIYNPIIGSFIGILLGFSVLQLGIQNVFETIAFSWERFQKSLLSSIMNASFISLVQFLFLGNNLIWTLSSFFSAALLLTVVASFSERDVDNKVLPNQGIRQSFKNSLMFAVVSFPFSVILMVFSQNALGFPFRLEFVLILASCLPISAALFYGGATCINHFTIRLILYCNGWLPWNYARFLDYCTERLLLERVGGRYRFIHKMLQDHFAAIS